MILKKITYLDNHLQVICVKTERSELETITPALVQYVTMSYSINLTESPVRRVSEQIRLDKKDIDFRDTFIVFSFQIAELHTPDDCELSLQTLTFNSVDLPPLKIKINKTYGFKSIQSETSPISENIKQAKLTPRLQKKVLGKKAELKLETDSKEERKKSEEVHFKEAYEKFRAKLEGTDLLELLRMKTGSVEFSLKSFGISLLCKTLLLVKQVNELVDNEFKNDLQEFLKKNLLESLKKEVEV